MEMAGAGERQETIGRSTCVRGEATEKMTRERGKVEGSVA
jgi:hypothetical protein